MRFLLVWWWLYPTISSPQLIAEESVTRGVKDQTLQEDASEEDKWDLLRANPEAVANIKWDIDWGVSNETDESMDFFHIGMKIVLSVPYDFFELYAEDFKETFFPIWKENCLAKAKNLENFFIDYSNSDMPKFKNERRIWRPATYQDPNQGIYSINVWLPHEAWVIFDENFHQFESSLLNYNSYFLENIKRVVKALLTGEKKEISDPHKRMWALWNEGYEEQSFVKNFEKKPNLRALSFDYGTRGFFAIHYDPKKHDDGNINFSHTLLYQEYETTKLLMEEYRNTWEDFNSKILVRLKRLINNLEEKAGIITERGYDNINTTTVNWKMKRGYSEASFQLTVPDKVFTHFGDEFSPEYKLILKDLENFYQNSPLDIEPKP